METVRAFQQVFNRYLVFLFLAFGILILSSCNQQQDPTSKELEPSNVNIGSNFENLMLTDVTKGELTEDDKVYESSYADYYDLDSKGLKEGTQVTLLLESKDFLPHLYLLDAKTGKVIAESEQEKDKLTKTQLRSRIALLNFKLSSSFNHQLVATSLTKALGRYELILCTGWVSNNNSSGFGSLREAVANAIGLGAICFDRRVFNNDAAEADKTISLEAEITVGSNAYIYGPGVNAVTVSGEGSTRIFRVLANTIVTMKGLTITKGWVNFDSEHGGAIYNEGNLTLRDSIVSDSFALVGGGISNFSEMSLKDVKIKNNTANLFGGGINNSALLILDSTSLVIGNTASAGGGMSNGGTITIQDRGSVTGNTARVGGGILNAGNLILKDYSSIVSNVAHGKGGGVHNTFFSVGLTMQNLAVISSNRATDGGGIYNKQGGPYLYLNGVNVGVNVIGNQPNNLAP